MENKKMTYNLYSTERRYRDETLISYYFKPNKPIIKKCSPIDIDGERYRYIYETGEIENYTKKDILQSYGASLRRTTIMMNMLLSMNDFEWFWTLTFDKDKIDRTNAEEVFNCYKKYIHNIKEKYKTFKYMTFPEQHEDGCYHFHLLTAGLTPSQMGLVNSGKVCCSWATKLTKYHTVEKIKCCSKEYFEKTKHLHELKETDGETIYNVTNFAYGFTTVSRIVSRERCNSYVKKYVEKALGSTEVFKKRFYYSSNLNVPSVVKRTIGADFDIPSEIDQLSILKNSPLVRKAKGQPHINYNVMQIKIDNKIKDSIDKGLIPFSEEETIEFEMKYGDII